MGSYSHKRFACPFYKSDRRRHDIFVVSCEAGIIRLPGRPAFNEFTNHYCCGGWRKCTLAAALKEYYEKRPGN